MTFEERVYQIHDVRCNQKYDKNLPYSFHLKCVLKQGEKYFKLCKIRFNYMDTLTCCLVGHDLIEDARLTYNDVIFLGRETSVNSSIIPNEIADIIYACTEEKGKNREERHSEKFYLELGKNRLAVFVKLCDIMANVLYSKLTNSSMFDKYQKEFPNLKEYLFVQGEYDKLWNDLEKELNLS